MKTKTKKSYYIPVLRPQYSIRHCLCCGKPFRSAGAMNRLCSTCAARGLDAFTTLPRTWV